VRPRNLVCESDRLTITWDDGQLCEYLAIWLCDNDPAKRDPGNGQRLIDVADLPAEPRISAGELLSGVVRLVWIDQTVSEISLDWLFRHRPEGAGKRIPNIRTWDGSDPDILRRYSFEKVSTSATVRLEWLERIASMGIAFLSGVPAEESKVLDVAAIVGWVRDTNYGRVFDVRAVPDPNNLAYTDLALGLHTDNPYREPVPGLQILHCVTGSQEGGISLFVDGFRAAEVLQSRDPDAFAVLGSTPVRFEFSDANTYLSAERPIIQQNNRSVEAIHYNNRSIAPLQLSSATIPKFYRAYRAFALLLRETGQILTTSLCGGEALVFNNRRVLHGRTAFPSNHPRLLQGCYLEHDGLLSQIAVLQRNGLY